MTPEEKQDLEKLHEAMRDEYEKFSFLMRTYLRLSPEDVKNAGHDSIKDALLYGTTEHFKTLKKLTAAHVKKWPDEGV